MLCCLYSFPGRLRVLLFEGERVSAVSTTGRTERTSDGVGVGSSLRAAKRVFRSTRCGRVGGSLSCSLVRCRPVTHRATYVVARRGRIREIGITTCNA